jgi:hypothetical protein
MLILDFEKLFEPYTGDGHTLQSVVAFLEKQAAQRGIDKDLAAVALQRTMMDLAEGKEFSKTKCRCGCGIDKSATDLIHATLAAMMDLDKQVRTETAKLLEGGMNARMLAHIDAENKKYIHDNTTPPALMDWDKSPVLNAIKKVRKK